jgi:phosphoribosylanthranilate isomerase
VAKIKICGLSTPETMQAALDAGADFVGLVFFAQSPRNVSLEKASHLADLVLGRAKTVALIVDAPDSHIIDIKYWVLPDFYQAHGNESPERISQIKALTGKPVIKAVKVATSADVVAAQAYAGAADLLLFDAKSPPGVILPGGNGLAFDWTILKSARHPFMLAGGLNPANVAEAIRVTGADMVDVSSGVESAPGVKDIGLIRKFIEAAKPAR